MDLKELARPFPSEDLEWRVGRCGKSGRGVWASVLAYITARAVMDRLDSVVGPENWKDRYWRDGNAVMCELSVNVNGQWIPKVDGSEESDIEAVKGGISGALKRAAVKWGIGRYLYQLTDGYAQIVDDKAQGAEWGKTKDGVEFYWLPPKLPVWALPEGYAPSSDNGTANKTEIKKEELKAKIAAVPDFKETMDHVFYDAALGEKLKHRILGAKNIAELKLAFEAFNDVIGDLSEEDRATIIALKETRKKDLM